MTIAGAAFDMDGLILDSENVFYRTFREACEELGWEGPKRAFLRSVGVAKPYIAPMLREEMGPDFPAEAVVERSYALADEVFEREGPPVKPGVTEALDALHHRGVRCVVATSTRTPAARRLLEKVDLLERFDAVVGGERVSRGKPEPDIFLEAAFELGMPAERIIVFEDSELGVRAASTAGMRVVMIPDLIEPSDDLRARSFAVLPSLAEAARRIDELLA